MLALSGDRASARKRAADFPSGHLRVILRGPPRLRQRRALRGVRCAVGKTSNLATIPPAENIKKKLKSPRPRPISSSTMRLLSFLSEIERALLAESPDVEGGAWQSNRMVNFHHGLARLTLTPNPAADLPFPPGAIFLQAFSLADGSLCLKASLNWKGSEALPLLSVYSTPATNWKLEASRIASTWLEGPPAALVTSAQTEEHSLLSAFAS